MQRILRGISNFRDEYFRDAEWYRAARQPLLPKASQEEELSCTETTPGFQTSPPQSVTGLHGNGSSSSHPVYRNLFIQQPSPEETLDKWVNEKPDEIAIRQQIANQIEIFNGNLKVGGDLDLSGCTGLTSLPEGLSVGGNLYLIGCTGLKSLPEGLSVRGDLYLCDCTGLTSLPEGLSVGGDLYLRGCTGLTSLPENLSFGGNLDLFGCTGITSLPENLSVGGNLYLSGCTGLTSLPENLSVGGDLNLSGWWGLTSLPENLRVGGDLDLIGCTGLTSLPEWVFQLQQNQTVNARNTGISLLLLQEYNSSQNSPGYRGPRIEFSILDDQSSRN